MEACTKVEIGQGFAKGRTKPRRERERKERHVPRRQETRQRMTRERENGERAWKGMSRVRERGESSEAMADSHEFP